MADNSNPLYLSAQDLDSILSPGADPDAAAQAVTTGDYASVQQNSADYQQQKAALAQQAILDRAAQIRAESDATENPLVGITRTMVSTGFDALEAPFQILMNAANLGITQATGQQTDADWSDIFNTNIGNRVNYNLSGGDEAFDPGTGWFGTDEDSGSARTKYATDAELAGALNGSVLNKDGSIKDMNVTLGQRFTGSVGFEKGSSPYSIISGAIDAGTRISDPSMYVGGAEIKGTLKTAQGFGTEARAYAAGARVGSRVNQIREQQKAAEGLLGDEAGLTQQAAGISERQREVLTLLDAARADAQSALPNFAVMRDEARSAAVDASTAGARDAESAGDSLLDQLRTAQMQSEGQVAALRADQASEVGRAQSALDEAQGAYDAVAAKPATKQLADGITIDSPMSVNVRPSPREARANEPDAWRGNFEYSGTPTEDSVALHQVLAHDADGNVVGHLFWNPETGLIEDIATSPEMRRKGIATALFDQATAVAEERGWKVPTHATRPEDLSEAGAAFKASEQGRQRPGELESATVNRDSARSHLEGLQSSYDSVTGHLNGEAVTYQNHLKKIEDLESLHRDLAGAIDDVYQKRALTRLNVEELGRRTADQYGVSHPSSWSDVHQMFRDLSGMRIGFDGELRADADAFMRYFSSSKSDGLAQGFAALDNPYEIWDLGGRNIPLDVAEDLARATDVNEVKAALTGAVARGALSPDNQAMMAVRAAARQALRGRDPDSLLGVYGKAMGVKVKATKYARDTGTRNVPWAAARDVSDREGMVELVSDMFAYAHNMNRPGRALDEALNADRYRWMNRMATAEDAIARKNVWDKFLHHTLASDLRRMGKFDPDEIGEIVDSLVKTQARAMKETDYNAALRAAGGNTEVVINGKAVNQHMATLEAELSDKVIAPDWPELRRVANSYREAKRVLSQSDPNFAIKTQRALMDNLFGRYWRTSILAFRGGYIARNLGDTQVRMFLAGHSSLFTNPAQLAAMAVSHKLDANNAFGRLMNKADNAVTDVTGKAWHKVDGEDLDMLEAQSAFDEVAAWNVSMLDPGKMDSSKLRQMGMKAVDPTQSQFHRGWANELGLLHASPLGREVLGVMTGTPSARIQKWYEEGGFTGMKTALVDYFWSSKEGRAHLESIRGKSSTFKDLIKTEDDLRGYLLDAGDGSWSLEARWNLLTDGLDQGIVDAVRYDYRNYVRDLKEAGVTKLSPKQEKLAKDARAAMAERLRAAKPKTEIKKRIDEGTWKIDQVRVGQFADESARSRWTQSVNRATDWFFDQANGIELALARLPEFKYSYWDHAATLARALSPEDAATLVENARKSLHGMPGSWGNRALRKVEQAAKEAKGNGDFVLGDLHTAAGEFGKRRVKSMFYEASKRNALAHSARLISPFAQAFFNSVKEWSKQAFRGSNRLYAATRVYQAAQGNGSNWLSDDPSNPDDAFFYSDPKSGQMMVGIPLVGKVMGAIASARSGVNISDQVSGASPLSGFNIIWGGAGVPNPGVGPMIQVPATWFQDSDAYQKAVPDWLKSVLVPYTQVNPDREVGMLESFTPAWAANIAGGLGIPGYGGRTDQYIKPMMATLFSAAPERYLNEQGLMDEQHQRMLIRDANAAAQGLILGRGVINNSAAAAVMPTLLVKDKNGNTMNPTILAGEYYDLMNATGSKEEALAQMSDKYGVEALMTMLPTREYGYTPTNDAYAYALDNPDKVDELGSVINLIYPGGGYSASFDRWSRRRFGDTSLTEDDIVSHSNTLLYQAQVGQLDQKLVRGEIDEQDYDAQTAALKDAYKDVPKADFNSSNYSVTLANLRKAAEDPTLVQTEAGHAIAVYLALRDQAVAAADGGALGGQDDAPLRAWLRSTGERLATDYPEFTIAWLKVFRSEVTD